MPSRPSMGRLEATRIAPYLASMEIVTGQSMERRIARFAEEGTIHSLHGIAHTADFWSAYRVARQYGRRFVLSVHDDLMYALQGQRVKLRAIDHLGHVWREADARTVISEEMGREYSSRYGERDYVIVTDGLEKVSMTRRPRRPGFLSVYFMGSIHTSYTGNFHVLVRALDWLRATRTDLRVRLICRGGLPQLDLPSFVEGRPWATQGDVLRDFEEVDLLYLPLPFDPKHKNFVRFSLPTKLVTYLGAGVPIVYHGPKKSSSARRLASAQAGIVADTLDPRILADRLITAVDQRLPLVSNAWALARRDFMLPEIRQRFWSAVEPGAASLGDLRAPIAPNGTAR